MVVGCGRLSRNTSLAAAKILRKGSDRRDVSDGPVARSQETAAGELRFKVVFRERCINGVAIACPVSSTYMHGEDGWFTAGTGGAGHRRSALLTLTVF